MKIIAGPLLKFAGGTATEWDVSILVVTNSEHPPQIQSQQHSGSEEHDPTLIYQFQKAWFWKTSLRFERPPEQAQIQYRVTLGNRKYEGDFFIPATGQIPAMAYGSCAGFHSLKEAQKFRGRQNERWSNMLQQHNDFSAAYATGSAHSAETPPFHLLMMGGDQVYADQILEENKETSSIQRWIESGQNTTRKFTDLMEIQVERFYLNLYLRRWSQPEPSRAYSRIPSLMMWDDHDIFDGWGSHDPELQQCPVYQGIFEIAAKYFRLFQHHSASLDEVPGLLPQPRPGDQNHSVGFHLGALALAALDLRGSRSSDQVMGRHNMDRFLNWLDCLPDDAEAPKHLILMLSLPLMYPAFPDAAEFLLEHVWNPGGLHDDLRDHWTSPPHRDEQVRLAERLLKFSREKQCRVTIVSGDVHVAATGVIRRTGPAPNPCFNLITQLVSSAIVNSPPVGLMVHFLNRLTDHQLTFSSGAHPVVGQMTRFMGATSPFIARRNWLSLQPDSQDRLWAKIHIEGDPYPRTKVIDHRT